MDIEVNESRQFEFYGKRFGAYYGSDKKWYVRLNDICEALGIDPAGQRTRIKANGAMADLLVNIPTELSYKDTVRTVAVAHLDLRALPFWLFTLTPSRMSRKVGRQIVAFQREALHNLWRFYQHDVLPEQVRQEAEKAGGQA